MYTIYIHSYIVVAQTLSSKKASFLLRVENERHFRESILDHGKYFDFGLKGTLLLSTVGL